ncbi:MULTISPECIES: hypothetical protein [Clostridium]|uniref:hypothetical protein n=1 Tax=Clostridium TaxID=1485 RepID=UPI000826CCDD|nr:MULTISPECIES: hypothetical protein [Clostridium]PJI06579.1 hypothetical protein CUB90_01280 [Clostridium sp. CT7]
MKINKKSEGGIEVVVATLVAVLALGFTMVYFISNMIPVINKYKVETVVRKYALKEEQEGYLSPSNVSSMESELKNIGISNINISGTTLSPVEYGEDVLINISYKDNIKSLTVKDGIIPMLSNEAKTITINKSSTSKKAIEP